MIHRPSAFARTDESKHQVGSQRCIIPSYPASPPKLKLLNAYNYTSQCRSRVNHLYEERKIPYSLVSYNVDRMPSFPKGYLS